MSKMGVRNIVGYNEKIMEQKNRTPKGVQSSEDMQESDPLPFIVVFVDEFADLMLVAGKEIETLIQRLAQMARASGIHIVMATQRPSVDVITGTIKANFPTRVSFQVTSKIDSRTILGEQGAEHLLGQGDMLYMASGGRVMRVHGPFVSDEEIERVTGFLKEKSRPQYVDINDVDLDDSGHAESSASSGSDDVYQQAVAIVLRDRKTSISYLQRQMQIGYNRAARLIETMEKKGILSPPNHLGKRDILS
jgi:S-DNA-T family DNA segregation ATPase FtsK/SpoIIIE